MPKFDGTGCYGAGPMQGRGMGPCGGTFSWGRGSRPARGLGQHCGWFSAGYGIDDSQTRMSGVRSMLEQRAAFLKMELERVEALTESLEGKAAQE